MQDNSLTPMIKAMHNGLIHGDKRYSVMDAEHIKDTKTGLEFHLYPDHYKVTKNGELMYSSKHVYDPSENMAMNDIRKMLVDYFEEHERKNAMANRQVIFEEFNKDVLFEKPEGLNPATVANTTP